MAGEMSFGLLNANAPAEAAMAPVKGMAAVNALAAQNLQNDAAQFELQNALAEREAYKQAAQTGNAPQALMEKGLGGKAVAYQQAQAKAQKDQSDLLKSRIEQSRYALDGVSTPEQYLQWHIANHQDPVMGQWLASRGITPEQSLQNIQRSLQTPGGFEKLLTESKLGSEKTIEMLNKQQERQQGTVPSGYRMTPQGNLELIPGGPTTTPLAPKEVQKLNAAYPKAESSVKAFEATSDDLIKKLEALKTHKGLEGILGTVYGRTGSLTADSQAAQQLYDTILAKGAFNELTSMRQASPTGGALGNVSNQEGQYLRQAFGALGRVQSKEDFQKAVDDVITQIQSSKARTRETFDETYSYRNNPTSVSAGGGKGNQKWQSALQTFEEQGQGR